jgi:hypothetical protein
MIALVNVPNNSGTLMKVEGTQYHTYHIQMFKSIMIDICSKHRPTDLIRSCLSNPTQDFSLSNVNIAETAHTVETKLPASQIDQ